MRIGLQYRMQAPSYTPTESFSDSERNNAGGRSTVRTALLDAELSAVSLSITALISNLALVQRSDGKLKDAIVEPYHFSAASRAYVLGTKWNSRGLWASTLVYAVNDMVDQGGAAYICAVAHTSGSFATDYTAGKWQIFTSSATGTAVSFTPNSTISSTNVQAAIEEVDSKARAVGLPLLSALYGGF